MSNIINGDLRVKGHFSADTLTVPAASVTNASIAGNADIQRSKHVLESLAKFPVPLTDFRVWDAMQTLLPNPSALDDLGMYGGTIGTNSPQLKTFDVKAAGAKTFYGRVLIPLPPEYEAGATVQLRLSAGMETTIADTSATVDVEAYEVNRTGGVSADLVTTTAQSINSLVKADKDFAVTASSLAPSDMLDVRVIVATNDAATITAVIAAIGAMELLCDIRG